MARFPAPLSPANLASSAALSPSRTTARTVAYWATTALVAAEMVMGGMWDVLRTPQVTAVTDRLGYPTYFLVILGVWKLLGAVALLVPRRPRLKEWAYAGAVFNYTGAIATPAPAASTPRQQARADAILRVLQGASRRQRLRPPQD